jgi:hypothetical protein
MTTAQESTNGHRFPPPSSVENPEQSNCADLPTNKANIDSNSLQSRISDLASPDGPPFPANGYHVPPKHFVPRPQAYRYDDTLGLQPETTPLPERCQFMFSDGRQCTMARSDIHPSLCTYHSDREEQLFGDPTYRREARALDFPELFSACRDLTTAAGVNRALAQVFRLLAQRRISRQEAATFGHLAQLLLRSISLARSSIESDDATGIVMPSAGESHHLQRKGYQQDALFAGNKAELSLGNKIHRSPEQTPTRGGVILSESGLADESKDLSASPPVKNAPTQCTSAPSPNGTRTARDGGVPGASYSSRPQGIDSNSLAISTYKNVEDKPAQNQHLHKSRAGKAHTNGAHT